MDQSAKKYDPKSIEEKWIKHWDENKTYKTPNLKDLDMSKPKMHVLDMFPYPSGEGLHVGHSKVFGASDIYSRLKRMQGYNVLHATGWDAFGLPAEQYAIKNKISPKISTKTNTENFAKQMKMLGLSYDWDRTVNTTDPQFYKWTQWIFKQLYKDGLCYESFEPINWCPSCKTGLANEDLENGLCERCGSVVEKKPIRQWVIKITDYAEKLLKGVDGLDWKENIKEMQRNWIGESEGAEIQFQIKNENEKVRPLYIDDVQPPKPDLETTNRKGVIILVKHWSEDKYLLNISDKYNWKILFTGGIEEGESPYEAAKREVLEETGYKNIKSIRTIDFEHTDNFERVHKGDNAMVEQINIFVTLADGEQTERSEVEKLAHKLEWHSKEEMSKILNRRNHKFVFDYAVTGDYSNFENVFAGYNSDDYFGVSNSFTIFTTRPDTLFGCTYCVFAPEHKLVKEYLDKSFISNQAEVKKYVEEARNKSEMERSAEGREKTGVKLEGVYAVNPANGKHIPIYVADYVLGNYGTGAIMAVPAHDERDREFADKFGIETTQVVAPYIVLEGESAPKSDKDIVHFDAGTAIVKHWSDEKYYVVDFSVNTGFVGGHVEEGETPEQTAMREVTEETGYKNIKSIKQIISHSYSRGYKKRKDREEVCHDSVFLVTLKDGERVEISDHETKQGKWMSLAEVNNLKNMVKHHRFYFEMLNGNKVFVDTGLLVNSGKFDEMNSEEAKIKITEFVGGKMVKKYKLRDWVFARQRYWGEPFPIVFDENHKSYVVADSELPVVLPDVESYEPTGTGEGPLADIKDWLEVKGKINENGEFVSDPNGKTFYRETNTMPQWAGSSWYWLRYMDPNNHSQMVGKEEEKYWSSNGYSVDMYLGGMEHATRHLIYGRFWNQFLHDKGILSVSEPFKRLEAVGLIHGEDGSKMSKRLGNVINPDDVVKTWGADTLRLYIAFTGPFHDSSSWNSKAIIGPRRFIERVWDLQYKLKQINVGEKESQELETALHQTIKKCEEDYEKLQFNTAIAQMMIFVNAVEKNKTITQTSYETFLKLLAPVCPFVTEEIWYNLGYRNSIHLDTWPKFDPNKIVESKVNIAVQINGKLRDVFQTDTDMSDEYVIGLAKATEGYKKWVAEATPKKVIVVKNKIVNIII